MAQDKAKGKSGGRGKANDPEFERRRAMRELRYAVIATGLTLVVASSLYLYVPVLREQMAERDIELKHERLYEFTDRGGRIIYTPSEALLERHDGNAEELLVAYEADLQLLKRRFERGQFGMATLPGISDSPEYAGVQEFIEQYTYSVERDGQAARLVIQTNNPRAAEAMQAYLKYLEERWVFTG